MAKGDIKRRREIERLSASLPSITPAQEWYAQKVCASAWVGKKKAWCDGWRSEGSLIKTSLRGGFYR